MDTSTKILIGTVVIVLVVLAVGLLGTVSSLLNSMVV